ncbi:MAG TPA: DJ-1/PfpI family protein [Vicinamibacterales bacterium]|nr:DJ-1/PfpI family protein [Vicinamibacterales bacterium]
MIPEQTTMPLPDLRSPLSVGMVLFPNLTQLDLTGPYEVFTRLPGTQVHLVAAALTPVRSERGLTISPDATFDSVPALDIICVPGGAGADAMMEDEALLQFLRSRAPNARYVTSVCTGALVLGAAGLLRGYRATTHWLSQEILPLFGAQPVDERVVIDRNRITGGGVTAGIDFGLVVAAEVFGQTAAERVQLTMEYCPAPRFDGGSPKTAPADVVREVIAARAEGQTRRRAIAERAAARLGMGS